jgi:NO-binding membrane sensor protein with MHYT domain
MAQIHQLQHGWITPVVSYLLSVLGSMLGLTCALRQRTAESRRGRIWWLVLGAVSLGGTAIWSMHFVGMLGFGVDGTAIRYNIGLTVASAIIAIVAVGIGLSITTLGNGNARTLRVVTGGVIAGLGIAAMHYMGIAAMRLNGDIEYGAGRVVLSVVIALVAATAALWLAITVRRPLTVFLSALIMGVAVNGMHFTGMSAMSVEEHPSVLQPSGASGTSLIVPIGVALVFAVVGLGYALLAAPTEEDRAAAAYLAGRRTGLATAGGTPDVNQDQRQLPGERGTGGSGLGSGNWTYRDRSN